MGKLMPEDIILNMRVRKEDSPPKRARPDTTTDVHKLTIPNNATTLAQPQYDPDIHEHIHKQHRYCTCCISDKSCTYPVKVPEILSLYSLSNRYFRQRHIISCNSRVRI